MKKFFTFVAVVAACCMSASATPYKALYAEAEVVPSGAGVIYMNGKNAEDEAYIFDQQPQQTDDWDESAYMMWVGGENSDGAEYPGCTGGIGIYEVKIQAEINEGYEIVCLANTIKEDGIYTEADCYAVIHGEAAATGFTFDFDYSNITEMGVKISVNNPEHPQDGHSSDGPSRDEVFENFAQYVSDTPDAYVYVIFRKIGDELPKFVADGDPDGIRSASAEGVKDGATYNLVGQKVGKVYKGIFIRDGKKLIVK